MMHKLPKARCCRSVGRRPSSLRHAVAACRTAGHSSRVAPPTRLAPAQALASCTRRHICVLSSALVSGFLLPNGRAAADELTELLPTTPAELGSELPKPYVRNLRNLIKTLRTSLEAEAEGAKEFEVRRKADPAKEFVKEFVSRWRDDPLVTQQGSHAEIKAALSELGSFYTKAGPRSRLSDDVRNSVLAHLSAAEAALPKENGPQSILGL